MQTINLKKYYPFCTEDTFVEVSDEIVEAFLLDTTIPGGLPDGKGGTGRIRRAAPAAL